MAKVPDTKENMGRCICGGCPSYPGGGALYCATGKSPEQVTKQGCICGGCPVYAEYKLGSSYYCVSGMAE